jgi:hypothetical protein
MQTLSGPSLGKTERFPNPQLDARLTGERAIEIERILDTQRASHAAAPKPQHDAYVTRLCQRREKGTLRSADHLLVEARNQFERGASQLDVEAVFDAYKTIIASWYEPVTVECLKDVSKLETITQGPADVAQIDIDKAEGADLAARERRIAEHHAKSGQLLRCVRRRLYSPRSTRSAA